MSNSFDQNKTESDKEQMELEAYNKERLAARGTDIEAFLEKEKWLWNYWEKQVHSESRILMMRVIRKRREPIHNAIIADNLEYFKTSYLNGKYDEDETVELLEAACFCGSPKVARFLLESIESDFTKKEHQYLLCCIFRSNNPGWLKQVALEMAQAGCKMPGPIHSFWAHDDHTLDELIAIFKGNQQPTASTSSSSSASKP